MNHRKAKVIKPAGQGLNSNLGPLCENCLKPSKLCVCESIEPITTKTRILILQHPQEPDKILGTAHIAKSVLDKSVMKIGLSWRNLDHAAGFECDRKEWAVLYLGNKTLAQEMRKQSLELCLVNKKDQIVDNQKEVLKTIKGVIALDGTWSQAKTLWWRNAWLSKMQRIVLLPKRPSLYGRLRKEPRPESLATIESLALTLSTLENNPEITEKLLKPFKELLAKASR